MADIDHTVLYKFSATLVFVIKVKQSHYSPWTGPEDARRLKLINFKTIGT
jgi:hypothetical protein